MNICSYCGGGTNTVSSVSAFRAKRASAEIRHTAAAAASANRIGRSNLPGDAPQGSTVSKLPGDLFAKNARKRAFTVFGSMREAFAVAA